MTNRHWFTLIVDQYVDDFAYGSEFRAKAIMLWGASAYAFIFMTFGTYMFLPFVLAMDGYPWYSVVVSAAHVLTALLILYMDETAYVDSLNPTWYRKFDI